jgi:hypothetical protein
VINLETHAAIQLHGEHPKRLQLPKSIKYALEVFFGHVGTPRQTHDPNWDMADISIVT